MRVRKLLLFLLPKDNRRDRGTCTPEEPPRITLLCMASATLRVFHLTLDKPGQGEITRREWVLTGILITS